MYSEQLELPFVEKNENTYKKITYKNFVYYGVKDSVGVVTHTITGPNAETVKFYVDYDSDFATMKEVMEYVNTIIEVAAPL
jgi:spore coat polysaccharide biosynthesis protein SpsF (cytidylyltransferase family)